jgi:hypothetical protein
MAKTLCVLVLIGITTMIGYSQETASEYLSPAEAIPRGKAPKMQVQLLNPGESTRQYAVIFYSGDEAFPGLLEFAEKYQVTSAHFTAIGALNGATLVGAVMTGAAPQIIPAGPAFVGEKNNDSYISPNPLVPFNVGEKSGVWIMGTMVRVIRFQSFDKAMGTTGFISKTYSSSFVGPVWG